MNRKVYLPVQIAGTAILVWLLLSDFDWAEFGALFRRLPLWFYVLSFAVVIAGQLLYAWRWLVVLRASGVEIDYTQVVQQHFVGLFVSNFLPSTIGGDAAKVYYLGREYGYRPVAMSVLVDRALGLGSLALLGAGALWISPIAPAPFVAARAALSVLAVLALVVLIAVLWRGETQPTSLRMFGPRAGKLLASLQQARVAVAGIIRPPVMVRAAAVAVVYMLGIVVAYGGFIALQTGQWPLFVALFAAITASAVLSNIPITINGVGLREQLYVVLLQPLGVPREVAVALSLLFFGHVLIGSLVGGLLWSRMPPKLEPLRSGEAETVAL